MIAFTGANGQLGRLLTQSLARSLRGAPFRAFSRDPRAAGEATNRPPGADFCGGDFDDVENFTRALEGTRRLLIISTADPNELRLRRQRAAIEAARRASVEHVVYLSFLAHDPASPFPFAVSHDATEQALVESGLRWTILRPGLYLDALQMLGPDVARERAFFVPAGDGRVSFLSRHDLADILASVLTTEGHAGAAYALTGAESLSYGDIAAELTRVLGHEVRFVDVTEDDYRRRSAALGPMLEPFLAIWRTIRDGHLAAVSPDASRFLGRAPEPVEAWLEAHRASFV
jgi:NAD(P)H dehydrogenase (quinone)